MQRFPFVLLVFSFAVFTGLFAGAGCKKSTDDGGDDSTITGPDGGAVPQNARCDNVSPQSPIANCDLCTRDQCCVNVLDCENSADCKAYRACIAPCKPGDLSCSDVCLQKHPSGQRLASIVGQCQGVRCPDPCSGISVEVGDGG